MTIFKLSEQLIKDYSKYVQSFLTIQDQEILAFLNEELIENGALWPDALLQVNPAYEKGGSISDLCNRGKLVPQLDKIFYDNNKQQPIELYRHQLEAIDLAIQQKPFIVTSGTGSGKTLTYFVPIFDYILRHNPEQHKVQAIVVYPMNALVNSQCKALDAYADSYKQRTGQVFPVRYKKYTGQDISNRSDIQRFPPHILLTNYVMLELMLVRPGENAFVDRTTTGLQFLVLDELHTYRGRQGADISLLVRRLKERAGNLNMLCIGTSATMASGKGMGPQARHQAVSEFGSKIFGTNVPPENVVEERLQRVTTTIAPITKDDLVNALSYPVPDSTDTFLASPLSSWIEQTFGIYEEERGNLRRQTPISVRVGAKKLSEITGIGLEICENRLEDFFQKGTKLMLPDGRPVFAFKLHHFFAQGKAVYATLERPSERYLTLEGQYYAPDNGSSQRILYPLTFCRVCGQEYYSVVWDQETDALRPRESTFETSLQGSNMPGYLMLMSENNTNQWSVDHIPPDWMETPTRIKRNMRPHVPQKINVLPDGSVHTDDQVDGIGAWFQPVPFMLCQNCGEFYTLRDKNDFRKLTRLSSEGRSTTTTLLTVSGILNSPEAGIEKEAQKILSFTDNRQDASLQAGHFNDFVQVSFLRSAIYAALEKYSELNYDTIPNAVTGMMNLSINDVARNKDLDASSSRSNKVWSTFNELVAYLVYEDLRRGWRVVQPNLEQCGLLHIDYQDLSSLCNNETKWSDFPEFAPIDPERREKIIRTILDHFRKKLAIYSDILNETEQQQMRRRFAAELDPQWWANIERMTYAQRFLLSSGVGHRVRGMSLSDRSLLGRYLRRQLNISGDAYWRVITNLMKILNSQGLVFIDSEGDIDFVQLDGAAIIWRKGDGTPPPPDPVYSRQVFSPVYIEVQRNANIFFKDFYVASARWLKGVEGREHTAQVNYEDRQEREQRFTEGKLQSLFCSPTMELGVDIRDLQLVHMRNVPPTPANYAQRSGRAGRGAEPALVMTYCSALSGHDQYYFHKREDVVAGSVRAPRLDLSNEDLIKAHVHAIWLAKAQLPLGNSIADIIELSLENFPLNSNLQAQIQLSDARLTDCINEAETVLQTCELDKAETGWYSRDWLESQLRDAPRAFEASFNRWRELYQAAQAQWESSSAVLRNPPRDRDARANAERTRAEAERQKTLLCNIGTTFEESDFYPYRYLASEGFLPGYNFPRLPIRAFVPKGDGEYISRPRFLALSEFGPRNFIYHEGSTYEVGSLIAPPGGMQPRLSQVKVCYMCGYIHSDYTIDCCSNCQVSLDASNSEVLYLLDMSNVRTFQRQRITCDEEERQRIGFEITTHYRFAPAPGSQDRVTQADVIGENQIPLLQLQYAPTATLSRINHGWRNRRERGFLMDLLSGEYLSRPVEEETENETPVEPTAHQQAIVRLIVQDTENMLLIQVGDEDGPPSEAFLASLEYALQRGIEITFQVEEAELSSERIGQGESRSILIWEAAEGGVGVLRRLVEEPDAIASIARTALDRLHFDPETFDDNDPDCAQGCYECLLSYSNQRDHAKLDRHLVKNFLIRLTKGITKERRHGRTYEEQYQWLRSLTDSRSELERKFVDRLFHTNRRLPDDAQQPLADYFCIPDFFYRGNVCVFCDGSVHDEPAQQEEDIRVRRELEERGYRVVVIRYDRDVEEQLLSHPDIFGAGR